MRREKYHVCILVVRIQPLVYHVRESSQCSPVHSGVYIMRIHVIFAMLEYYYLLINVNSPNYICGISAIWLILPTIVDYW